MIRAPRFFVPRRRLSELTDRETYVHRVNQVVYAGSLLITLVVVTVIAVWTLLGTSAPAGYYGVFIVSVTWFVAAHTVDYVLLSRHESRRFARRLAERTKLHEERLAAVQNVHDRLDRARLTGDPLTMLIVLNDLERMIDELTNTRDGQDHDSEE